MGCFHSKSESSDPHFNVFRVENVDESGTVISIGRIEITETHLVFHRESSDSTKWPLHSLRRYGFEAGVFSFEAGRRCDTGEGIYAFHCRRASLLFRSLQQQIQLLNVVQESGPYPLSGLSPSPHGRPTLQATIIHRSSIDGGHTNMQTLITSNLLRQSGEPGQILEGPRSSLSADILEVTPLYPHSHSSGNHIANVYQLRDFKREHNNNQSTDNNASDVLHSYTNDLSRDLAILRNKLRQETAINTMRDIEEEAHFLQLIAEKVSSNNANNTLSPTRSTSSEHYAQLTIEQKQLQQQQQEGPRLYVNVVPNENVPENTKKVDSTTQPVIPTTPVTPKQVEYCNLTVGNKVEVNTYANLMLSDMADSGKSLVSNTSEHNHKYSESDTFTSLSPVEELEVNYAVLDIESHKEADKMTKDMPSPENVSHSIKKDENTASCPSQTRSRLISQSSMEKPVAIVTALVTAPQVNIGYTTIDFDKTVALTSVAAGADTNMEGPRKTRNNSCSVNYGSPNSADKSK